MDARRHLGNRGEDSVVELYRSMGFDVLERNFSTPDGEIDLIAGLGKLVVFCEVKTRRSGAFGAPAEAVHPVKRSKIRRTAGTWLRERGRDSCEVRFDVASVIVTGGRFETDLIVDAF